MTSLGDYTAGVAFLVRRLGETQGNEITPRMLGWTKWEQRERKTGGPKEYRTEMVV